MIKNSKIARLSITIIITAFCTLLISSCGKKGALYLEEDTVIEDSKKDQTTTK